MVEFAMQLFTLIGILFMFFFGLTVVWISVVLVQDYLHERRKVIRSEAQRVNTEDFLAELQGMKEEASADSFSINEAEEWGNDLDNRSEKG